MCEAGASVSQTGSGKALLGGGRIESPGKIDAKAQVSMYRQQDECTKLSMCRSQDKCIIVHY
jgi:hypothetical protein